jgi:membrane-associated phospholipid phosphatase
MRVSWTEASAERPGRGRVCVATLLGLIVIVGSVSAEEIPSTQPGEGGHPAGLVMPVENHLGAATPVVDGVDGTHDPGSSRQDRSSWPRIDWLASGGDPGSPPVPPGAPAFFEQQPAAQHPEPTHTGFKALVVETGRDFKAFPRRRSTWVILAVGGAAAAIAYPFDDEVNARLAGSDAVGRFFAPGKYIGSVYVQAGTAVGLYVIGRYMLPHPDGESRTNKVSHLGFDLVRGLIVSQALTQGIKITVQRDRPTGECCAFPSGHASATFATAAVLERHLGYRAAWPTFAIAAYVGASRLHDNRHFLSDVLFGGALGIASGWTVVGRHGRSNYALMRHCQVNVDGAWTSLAAASSRGLATTCHLVPDTERASPQHAVVGRSQYVTADTEQVADDAVH